ncbi:MAG: FeS cluster assembly protein SufD [Chlamydiae bacterium]|nr:FeS cluster assembly protein SufD [Chlamydiota bacterium]
MKERFIANLETTFRENLEGIHPLQKVIREKAWDRFLELGLPEKKHPGYQYLPLSQIFQESFGLSHYPDVTKDRVYPFLYPETKRSHIVFLNGQYAPELSDTSALPEKVVILRLKDALSSYGNFLQVRLARALKEETDPFAMLNLAMIQMGLFFYVPPETVIDKPVQCIHLIDNDRPSHLAPRIHFFLGRNSKMNWFYEGHCLKDYEYFSNSVVDVALEEGASFSREGVINPCKQGWYFDAFRVTQKRDSRFSSAICTTGCRSVRQDFRISLMGENASCDLRGVALLSGNKQAHVNILIDHVAPHCTSNQLFKNVLADTSRSSFEGKIYVHPKAQKTIAYQLNHNLLLDDRTIANSKPNLEIFADDVKASHGATVTQINPEHLFYLTSRGIDPKKARLLLLSGFSLDVMKNISYLPLRERLVEITEKSFG